VSAGPRRARPPAGLPEARPSPGRAWVPASRRGARVLRGVAALALVALQAGLAAAGIDVWTTQGPEGGAIVSLGIDPVTPSTLYAGTGGSGVFTSPNGGTTWATSQSALSDRRVSRLVVDPATPTTLYALSPSGAFFAPTTSVFKTTDGGASWNTVNTGLPAASVNALAIDPATPTTLYAGTGGSGVFKTTNGGGNWSAANAGLTDLSVRALVVDPSMPAVLYTGTANGGVFRSSDGGSTWSPANTGLTHLSVSALAIDPLAPAILYLSTPVGVFRTTDGGGSWALMTTGLTDVACILATDPATSGTVYAGTATAGVFKTTNGGGGWTPMSTGLTDLTACALAIDPATPTTLYAGTNDGVFASLDGGGSWAARRAGLTTLRVSRLAIDPLAPTTLYAGSDVGVFRSLDSGASWVARNAGLTNLNVRTIAVDPVTPTTLYAGVLGPSGFGGGPPAGGVFKSTDGGASWAPSRVGIETLTIQTVLVDPVAPTTVYAAAAPFGVVGQGGVFKSTDGGGTWIARNAGLSSTFVDALAMDPVTPTTLYAVIFSTVFRSTDGAATWTQVGSTGAGNVVAVAIDPATPSTLYAGTSGSGVLKSTDGGASWRRVNVGLASIFVTALAIDPTDPAVVFAATAGGGVFTSSDGGGSWSATNAGLTTLFVDALVATPTTPRTLYAGTRGRSVFDLRQTAFTVTVGRAGLGSGTVSSGPAGISCGTDCAESYGAGTPVTLSAVPAAGSRFAGWSGGGCSGTGGCTVTLAADTKVIATFTLQAGLTVNRTGTGAGAVVSAPAGIACGGDCAEPYDPGTVVTLTAVPAPGSVFGGWSLGGCSGTGPCEVVVPTTGTTVFASFVPAGAPVVTLTVTAVGRGTITSVPPGIACGDDCTETYLSGSTVGLVAIPGAGAAFLGWSGDADCQDGLITVVATMACTAEFASLAIDPVSGGNLESANPAVSADGRFVAFESTATDLVATGCTTGVRQIFVRDRVTGTLACVSVGADGTPGDGASALPAISRDGTVVAFESVATNLDGRCPFGSRQIFVRDRVNGTTTCVSVTPAGGPGNVESGRAALSADGRVVAFESGATNLASACATGVAQIFVRDRVAGTTTCASVGPGGVAGNLASSRPAINQDGGVVAFESAATNLVDVGCTEAGPQVFARTLATGATTCASVGADGAPGDGASRAPAISADGTRVAFESVARNLASPCSLGGASQIFVHDLVTRATTCQSVAPDGTPGNASSISAALSGDGQVVGFESAATNLSPGQGGGALAAAPLAQGEPLSQVFRRLTEVVSSVSELLSHAGGTPGNGASKNVSLSGDGTVVAFQSAATQLVGGDANGQDDVFVIEGATAATPGVFRMTAPASGTVFALVPGLVTPVTFTWTALPAAARYGFEFTGVNRQFANPNGLGPDGVNGFGGAGGGFLVTGGSFTAALEASFPLGAYQVRVIPLADTGAALGPFSDALSIVLTLGAAPGAGRPAITAPPSGATLFRGLPATFAWTVIPGAVEYFFEFTGVNQPFTNPNAAAPDPVNGLGGTGGGVRVVSTSFTATVPGGLTPGSYQVRVIGVSAAGQPVGTFSDAITVSVQ
jgi:photosystem II stability/assembly factor-like uncharacterized protein/Tol biopolymer transport system component